MKIQDVRELDAAVIGNRQKEAAEEAFHLRMKLAMGQTETLKKIRTLRKDRARMLTVLLRERELGSGNSAAGKGSK